MNESLYSTYTYSLIFFLWVTSVLSNPASEFPTLKMVRRDKTETSAAKIGQGLNKKYHECLLLFTILIFQNSTDICGFIQKTPYLICIPDIFT